MGSRVRRVFGSHGVSGFTCFVTFRNCLTGCFVAWLAWHGFQLCVRKWYLRWCYTRWFTITIFSTTQRWNILAILFRLVKILFQHCNAVMREKSSLQIAPTSTRPTNTNLKYHVLQVITKGRSERVCRVGGGRSVARIKHKVTKVVTVTCTNL